LSPLIPCKFFVVLCFQIFTMQLLLTRLSIISLTVTYSFLFLDTDTLAFLTEEDSLFENVSAFFFLITSLLFFITYSTNVSGSRIFGFKLKRNIYYLLLGFLFLFGFFEEISWGQRILSIETPEKIAAINIQGEINFHNLKGVDMSLIFSLFWLCYCFIIPLICKFQVVKVRKYLRTINLPLIPFWIGILFPINYIISKIVQYNSDLVANPIVELKEYNFAVFFSSICNY